MASMNFFDCFYSDLAKGIHNLSTHEFKFRLTSAAPVATMDKISCITTIATGNGWTTDQALTIADATATGSTFRLTFSDATVEAAGGSIGDFQYVVIYNSNDATGHLVGWYDYGSSVTLADGEKLTIDFADGDTGVITVTS